MSNGRDVIFEIDLRRATVTFYQSGPWADCFGYQIGKEYPYEQALTSIVNAYFDRDDKEKFFHASNIEALRAAFARKVPILKMDARIRMPESSAYEWYRITAIAPVFGKTRCTIQYVHEEKMAELLLRRQAEHDPLTGLLNRSAFDTALNGLFAQGVTFGAFFILDIDNFKQLNDTKGHQFGDEALKRTADDLRRIMPEQTLIGRFGGDEFVLFLPADSGMQDLEHFKRAVRKLCQSINVNATGADCPLSLGVAFYPQDGAAQSELLRNADCALYHVKHSGKNGYDFYDSSMPEPFDRFDPPVKKRRKLRRAFNWRRIMPLLCALLVAIGVLGFLTYTYLSSLQTMIRSESTDFLYEIADQINISTLNTLRSYSSQIGMVGSDLSSLSPNMRLAGLCRFLKSKSIDANCDFIAAVDDQNVWHTQSRHVEYPMLNHYLADCVLKQRTRMSEAVEIDGTNYLLIFVPAQIDTSDGYTICALVAFYRLDMMHRILALEAFDGAGHVDIVTREGYIVIRSDRADCILNKSNLFSAIRAYEFTSEGGYDAFSSAFFAGKSGSCRILVDGTERIIHFSKLDYQDWMLFASVPASTLEARSQSFIRITLYACLGITLLFCTLFISLGIIQARNRLRLEKLAYIDRITGMASREKFCHDAARLLQRGACAYSMVYTNVDRFKVINDRLGTDGANGLLATIAQTLDSAVSDNEAAGRIDADHFGVLLNTQDRDAIIRRIRSWNRVIYSYAPAGQIGLTISMSYGVYYIDDAAVSIDMLLDRSNLARRARKNATADTLGIYFYDNALRDQLLREQLVSDHMEHALEEGRFLLYLQPQHDAKTGALVGFEALARWQSTQNGLLAPMEFIPVFERNGFIIKLDLYMFEQVCKVQRALLDSDGAAPPISFNVSRVHFASENLLAPYLAIWEKYRVPPQGLEFEFTESVICDNPELLRHIVDRVHLGGFRCSMDDFGAGSSSLNMLNRTNVDVIKIDKSFLGDGEEPTARSKAILRSVISLSRELGMKTVAEGVEYERQAAFLRDAGCDVIQGFYYAKPMPAEDALSLWKSQKREPSV